MKSLTSLFIIALCIVAYFVYIKPSTMEVKGLMKKSSEYSDFLQKAKDLASKRDEVSAEFNSISSTDLDRLGKMVPETLDQVGLANDLNTLVVQSNLKISDFKIDGSGDTGQALIDSKAALPYKTNTVTMKVTGQYSDLLQFLSKLEANLRLMDVYSLDAEAGPDNNNLPGPMNFSLQIRTYTLK